MTLVIKQPVLRKSNAGRKRSIDDDLLGRVWVVFELRRHQAFARTGKRPSTRQVARELAAAFGLISVIGGDRSALAKLDEKRKKKRATLVSVEPTDRQFVEIYAKMRRRDAGSIRNLYITANMLAKADSNIELVWRNRVREVLNLPLQPRKIERVGRTTPLQNGTYIPKS